MSKERLELLDLFYGVNGKALTIPEIASMYNIDYIKMHDKISDARDAAIVINSGIDRGLDLDKSLYVQYVLDPAIYFTLEARAVLKLFIVDNKTYDEISSLLGLTKYRISNIITENVRKMDGYRFGLFEVERIDEDTLNSVFDYFGDDFLIIVAFLSNKYWSGFFKLSLLSNKCQHSFCSSKYHLPCINEFLNKSTLYSIPSISIISFSSQKFSKTNP